MEKRDQESSGKTVVWNVALTDEEVDALAAGVDPFSIRPGNIVYEYEVVEMDERMWEILHTGVLPYPQPLALYKCGICGCVEEYWPGYPHPLPCNQGSFGNLDICPGIMIQMEPFPSDRLLPRSAWNRCKWCKGPLRYVSDEYDSLANGGSYEQYECMWCGHDRWFMLPD